MTTIANENSVSGLQKTEWCPCCQHRNNPADQSCVQCGSRLSLRAIPVAVPSVWAIGQIYRTAIAQPRHPVVVAGVWMIGLAAILCGAAALVRVLANPGIATLTWAIIGASAMVWAAILMVQSTRNFRAARSR